MNSMWDSTYYIMHFPCVALAIKLNANVMILLILHFVFQLELNTLGVIPKCYALFPSKRVWIVGNKSRLRIDTGGLRCDLHCCLYFNNHIT